MSEKIEKIVEQETPQVEQETPENTTDTAELKKQLEETRTLLIEAQNMLSILKISTPTAEEKEKQLEELKIRLKNEIIGGI